MLHCKVITGSKSNCERNLQQILDTAKEVISLSTSPNGTKGIYITIIYKPR